MIEINRNPSPREVRIFGLLWLVFFGALGGVVLWRPEGLAVAAIVLGSAWLVSLAFNPEDRRGQLAGALLPALFGLSGGAVLLGAGSMTVALLPWGLALVGAVAIWMSHRLGRRIYVAWMIAALPIGWTLSHLVLGAVYYAVLTPVGRILRLVGRDPMKRRFDRSARSYWVERRRQSDPARYFRQF